MSVRVSFLRPLVALVMVASTLLFGASHAGAQTFDDEEVYVTCGLYATVLSTGGDTLIEAANELQELAPPNPPGIDEALDVVRATEAAAEAGDEIDTDAWQAALDTLDDYYGPICESVDRCPLIDAIGSDDRALVAEAAPLLADLGRPNPPGISIAFIAIGDSEAPLDEYLEAQLQLVDYFDAACSTDDAADGTTDDTDGADMGDGEMGDADKGDSDTDNGSDTVGGSAGDSSSGDGAPDQLPRTGFGQTGLWLIFAAFCAFAVGGGFLAVTERDRI